MNPIRRGRAQLTFLCCVLAMPTCTYLLDGIHAGSMWTAVLAGALLGAAYLLLRPLLKAFTFPLGCLTLGLFGFVIDSALIFGIAHFVPGFYVDGYGWALLAALLVDAICLIVGGFR